MSVPERRWPYRVAEMLEVIARISDYTAGMDEDQFAARPMIFDAVVRNLIILGVAARHVPPQVMQTTPGVPWREIQGLGVALRNSYDVTDPRLLWRTIRTDLPPLVPVLREVLAQTGEPPSPDLGVNPRKGLLAKPPGGKGPRDY